MTAEERQRIKEEIDRIQRERMEYVISRPCVICADRYRPRNGVQLYCSDECRQEARVLARESKRRAAKMGT